MKLIVLFILALPAVLLAQTTRPTQKAEPFKTQITIEVDMNHLVFLPQEYGKAPAKKWPLMIFLHGAGERGSDLEKVETHGPPK